MRWPSRNANVAAKRNPPRGQSRGAVATPTAAALDPRSGAWRTLRAMGSVKGLAVVNGAVWDGHEAFVAAALRNARGQVVRAVLLAVNPKANALPQIDLSQSRSPSASART